MAQWFHKELASGRVPEPGGVVIRSSENPCAVRAEHCGENHTFVTQGFREGLAGGGLDDGERGAFRGVAAFAGCASLVRQFEFVQNVWVNDPGFHELGNEHDPIIGTQDGTLDFTMPNRPIKKIVKGLPAFTTLRGGAYFFLPGVRALNWLAALGS